MSKFEPKRLKDLSRVIQVTGGVLLEFEHHLSYQSPVFLSTPKFDMLFSFLDLRLHLLKGDFGRFKGYAELKVSQVCRLAFAPAESFEIISEYQRGSADFEADSIKAMSNFFQAVGLYQPSHVLFEQVYLHNHRDNVALVLTPVRHHTHPYVHEPIMEQYPRTEANDWDMGERKLSNYLTNGLVPEYAVVFSPDDVVALGGKFVRQSPEERFPNSPIQMLPSTEVDIVKAADVIKGITDMGTLPEQGYRLRVENGLGDVVLGLLTKDQLKTVAEKLTQ